MKWFFVSLMIFSSVSFAESEISPLKIGDDKNFLQFYGLIDRGLLIYDDGPMTLGYFPIDNNNAQSRFGLIGVTQKSQWQMGVNFEEAWDPYTTATANQNNRSVDWDRFDLRHGEIFFENKGVGKFWLGKGSTASDATAENDLSGTTLAGYASMTEAAGQIIRRKDGTLSTVQIQDAFSDEDGLGRQIRLRYDTPDWKGFSLSGSWGKGDTPTPVGETETDKNMLWDVALKLSQDYGDYHVEAAVAYSEANFTLKLVDGSFSVLHGPSGLSFTMAAAQSDQEQQNLNLKYIYAKLGYQRKFFEAGKTYFSIDGYNGDDLVMSGSQSLAYGFQADQSVDRWQTDFYLGLRSYHYKDERADYDPGFSLIAGASFRF